MSTAGTISEIALLALQIYAAAARQAGLTEEQAKAQFDATFPTFMKESEAPVEEVKP